MHVYEHNLLSLRRIAREAGLRNARVWLDPDILRQGKHRFTSGADKKCFLDAGMPCSFPSEGHLEGALSWSEPKAPAFGKFLNLKLSIRAGKRLRAEEVESLFDLG